MKPIPERYSKLEPQARRRFSRCVSYSWVLASAALVAAPAAHSFGAVFELSSLDGSNGFVINGETAFDFSGASVSDAGDVNGDGIGDVLIGAPVSNRNGQDSGAGYVVFGGTEVGSSGSVELSSLNGTTGFVLSGVTAFDNLGSSISQVGDVNDDGVDDFLIGAHVASPDGVRSGASYVVFGGAGLGGGGSVDLSSLNGSAGFVLNGVSADDRSGVSVSGAGDVNGDGIDDLIIGASDADPNGSRSGASYVVFGGAGIGSGGSVELSGLNGSNGFVLNGVAANDFSGIAVSGVGDVNGDGVDDFMVGANGQSAEASYVVFGAVGVGSAGAIELSSLDGTAGFEVRGRLGFSDDFGFSVSGAGDVNGDGIDDLLVGAPSSDGSNNPNRFGSGVSYVVFGGTGLGAGGLLETALLDGSNGFKLNGVSLSDNSGHSVSGVGDLDGDGIDDLLIGANRSDPNGSDSGSSYVVFGGSDLGISGSVELSSLNGTTGFVLNGVAAGDQSGWSVSGAGDFNGDGLNDILIGALSADPNGTASGASYVVFGQAVEQVPLPSTVLLIVVGIAAARRRNKV